MQQSTNLSSIMYYTVAGVVLSLSLLDSADKPNINLDNQFSSEIVKLLSEVDDKIVYVSKIKSALASLQKTAMIDSFDIVKEDTSDITTFFINIPKSKDVKKLIDTNMAIALAFDEIPENDREKFTTIQQMV